MDRQETFRKTDCEIIVPASAHLSFEKAADLLSMKIVKAGLNERFQVDMAAVRKAVNPRTVAIVGIAGTTGLGVVDPIDELSELALEENLYLHVDAAFGGFVVPFLKELGYKVPSLTLHSLGFAPSPSTRTKWV